MIIHERPPASATALRALIDAQTRAAIEAHVQDMIDFLDRLDGDTDLEPYLAGCDGVPCDDREGDDCDLEPNLGSLGGTAGAHPGFYSSDTTQVRWSKGSRTDLEGREDEDDEDGNDDEPSADPEYSLGSTGCINQEGWAPDGQWCQGDRELDTCDDEAGGDDEPTGDEMDGDRGSEDEPLFGIVRRDLAAEHAATMAEGKRLGAIIRRLSGAPEGNLRPVAW